VISDARQPVHPNKVSDQEVIERAVQALEVRTDVPPVLLVRQLPRHSIEPPIRPCVVLGHHREVRLHSVIPSTVQQPGSAVLRISGGVAIAWNASPTASSTVFGLQR